MKGLEREQMLGIIILVLILMLLFALVFLPLLTASGNTRQSLSFREACVFWSQTSFAGTSFIFNGKEYPMDSSCANELRLSPLTPMPADPNDPKWEQCRNLCRVSV